MENKEIITKFMQLKEMYCLQSKFTHYPFIESSEENEAEQVLVFDDQAEAEHYVQIYLSRHYDVLARTIKQEKFKDFYMELAMIGADTVVYVVNEEETVVPLDSIVRIDIKENGQPAPQKNDLVQLTMIYYMQEYYRDDMNRKDPEREQAILDLREEMEANFERSKFIAPVMPANKKDKTKPQTGIMLLNNPKGECFQPLFTDMWELRKFLTSQKIKNVGMMTVEFKDLSKLLVKDAKSFIINPAGIGMTLPRKRLMGNEES